MSDDHGLPPAPEFMETFIGPGSLPSAPQRIGHYRILQTLGEGGMGVVYEAEQLEPVRRKVALKVIKLGMDTEQVVRRFESERQALALMNHPNIARVYDAGATEDGRPYFVMECVRGVPITEYCDHNRLDTDDRLKLIIEVCEGVQHAHQKGVIHRDIKPSNVLVRHQDGKHVPKIIDFGVAKATSQRLTEKTFFTEMGQLIGTPEYMSPEQAEMTGLDIDTRTDVYLLGVLLYELLTGELPFDARQLREAGFDAFRRRVIEEEPPKPSTRVTGLGDAAVGRARDRRTELPNLRRLLKHDLDWITMKALEKDRARRYASASELARDIERHLRHEPVLACPPRNLYKLGKFVRRHKVGVAFAAVLIVLLAGFAVTMTVQAARIRQERDRANVEASRAKRVSSLLVDLFQSPDPSEALGNTITARAILDRGVEKVRDLEDEPLVQAGLLHTMGLVYGNLGLPGQARPLLELALKIRREQLGEQSLEAADTMTALAGLVMHEDFERAQQLVEGGLATRRKLLGNSNLVVAASLEYLGSLVGSRGEYVKSEALHREAFEIRERLLDADDPQLATSLINLAVPLKKQGRYDEALPLLVRALQIRERHLEPGHPEIAQSLERLANLYDDKGDYAAARDYHRRVLEIRRKLYGGSSHPQVASTLMSLAIDAAGLGELAEAHRLHEEALKMYEETKSLDSPFEWIKAAGYAALVGRRDEALAHLRRACIERGYSDARTLLANPNLRTLRGDPAFQEIVAAVRKRTGEP